MTAFHRLEIVIGLVLSILGGLFIGMIAFPIVVFKKIDEWWKD